MVIRSLWHLPTFSQVPGAIPPAAAAAAASASSADPDMAVAARSRGVRRIGYDSWQDELQRTWGGGATIVPTVTEVTAAAAAAAAADQRMGPHRWPPRQKPTAAMAAVAPMVATAALGVMAVEVEVAVAAV